MAKADTLPEILRPLMSGPSVLTPYCCVCGRTWPLNRHHVVRRGAGRLYRNGVEVPKPLITLCGSGNTGGCHGLAHQGRLHFRWVPHGRPCGREAYSYDGGMDVTAGSGGHWEWLLLDEPTKYSEALSMDGWRPLRHMRGF